MDLSTIVEIFSVIAVVSGLVFAGLELRQFRMSRERESALELFNTFQSPVFARGLQALAKLPDDLSGSEIEKHLGGSEWMTYISQQLPLRAWGRWSTRGK
jgi:hypothetical protein